MARGRLICASLGTSRRYAALHTAAGALSEFAQALYPLMVVHADDFGRSQGDAFTVKHSVFPTSPRSEEEFDAALDAMAAVGLIQRYKGDGRDVIEIVAFFEHQSGLHKRTHSRYPDPPQSPESPESPGASVIFPLKRREENGREKNGTEVRTRAVARACESSRLKLSVGERPPSRDSDFEEFWQRWPAWRRLEKKAARTEWKRLRPDSPLRLAIFAALDRLHADPHMREESGRYLLHPHRWLQRRRWEDEKSSIVAPTLSRKTAATARAVQQIIESSQ
jgi:hypothetical protein